MKLACSKCGASFYMTDSNEAGAILQSRVDAHMEAEHSDKLADALAKQSAAHAKELAAVTKSGLNPVHKEIFLAVHELLSKGKNASVNEIRAVRAMVATVLDDDDETEETKDVDTSANTGGNLQGNASEIDANNKDVPPVESGGGVQST